MKYDGLVPDKLWCQCCLLSIVLAPLSVPTVTCRIHTQPLIPKTPITSQMNCQKTAFLMWLSSKYMIVHQLQSKFFHLVSSQSEPPILVLSIDKSKYSCNLSISIQDR